MFLANGPQSKQQDPAWYRWTWAGFSLVGHLAGLNNRWERFPYAHPMYHRLIFLGDRPDQKDVFLQTPNQIEQNFFWKFLFSFREEKFLLNIFGKPAPLDAYLFNLCRNQENGLLLRTRVQLEQFKIRPRIEARKTGEAFQLLDPYLMRETECTK